jgi:hypothetical protein
MGTGSKQVFLRMPTMRGSRLWRQAGLVLPRNMTVSGISSSPGGRMFSQSYHWLSFAMEKFAAKDSHELTSYYLGKYQDERRCASFIVVLTGGGSHWTSRSGIEAGVESRSLTHLHRRSSSGTQGSPTFYFNQIRL